MISRFLQLIFAVFLTISPTLLDAGDFEYGTRPPLSVFDPTGILKPEELKEIAEPLAAYLKNEGIDIVVVILPDIGDAPPEHVAGRFAEAWCASPIHCVVLHVPGRTESPWIIPAGKLIDHLNPEQVNHAVSDARRRASSEPKDPDKIRAAAIESSDMLRYWMANAVNHSEMIRTESTKIRVELETRSRQWKIAVMAAIASLIPVLAGCSFLIVFLRKRGPGYFPSQTWLPRLGAPHAGGNHAVADLGSTRS